jgi:hypothetical protein
LWVRLMTWWCGRAHPMCRVLHIDEVAQITVVVDERALRISRSLVPEDVNVTETVLRPDIEFGPVSRGCLQELPFARVNHGLTSWLIRGFPHTALNVDWAQWLRLLGLSSDVGGDCHLAFTARLPQGNGRHRTGLIRRLANLLASTGREPARSKPQSRPPRPRTSPPTSRKSPTASPSVWAANPNHMGLHSGVAAS